ncbi:diacylglycerol kinase family lipid kinase [Caloramator sp. mosi_1]|uniref:diacylglycerol/lipid kinase family protein n=1 Tax=Caloramator sp. mosi_1 TaxID=3023090 RepID=UPI00235E2BCF|nr:diacylglycerol kinase family protein [Caloramator sp. mosi_1]WDC84956.1 diacylglycerol kinase family lipid kinase [Caloramator sp. mosi_1]
MLFIVNPKAGNGRALKAVENIKNICNKIGVNYALEFTSYPENAVEIANKNAAKFEKIIAVGGDGTLNEVLNGIVDTNTALGVLPCGTGNDFARTIYKTMDINKIIELLVKGDYKKCDVGKCLNKHFINIASVGLDAEIAHKVQRGKKIFGGKTSYLLQLANTLIKYKNTSLKIQIDDMSFESETLLTIISNGKYYGGGIMPAPESDIFDGKFDICHIKRMNKLKIPFLLNKYIKGHHKDFKEVSFYRGKKVKIESEDLFAVNLDGETFLANEVQFELKSKYVNLIYP